MRYFTLCTLLMTISSLNAQMAEVELPVNWENQKVTYSSTAAFSDSVPVERLFPYTLLWLSKNSDPPNSLQEIDFPGEKVISARGKFQVFEPLGTGPFGFIYYTLVLRVYNGGYSVEISDFRHVGQEASNGIVIPDLGKLEQLEQTLSSYLPISYRKTYRNIKADIEMNSRALLDDLKYSVEKYLPPK